VFFWCPPAGSIFCYPIQEAEETLAAIYGWLMMSFGIIWYYITNQYGWDYP
jgi:hypothetical protein